MTSIWHYAFVQHALLAGAIVAVVAGCVGPLVVLRNMAFAVHGVAEIGFTGAAGALLLGVSPNLGLLAFTLAAAAVMGLLGERVRERDVAVGATLAFGLGVGVLLLSLYARYATQAFGLLFGTILGISRADVVFSAAVGLVCLLALAAIYRPLRFASVDAELAAARGVPLRLVSAGFMLILAFAVAEAVQVVGVLLLLTLLISPAAAAERLTPDPAWAMVLSVCIALVCTLGGLSCALYIPWPVSFFVSALSFAAYLGARLVGPALAVRQRRAAAGRAPA